MDRLLVTGATGFMGQWTLRHWRASHPDVQIWATSDQGSCPSDLADEYRVLDLRIATDVRDLVRDCHPTQVVHLAGLVGQAPLADHLKVNVLGTENLYNALADIEEPAKVRIVQAGTAAIYGHVRENELPVSEQCLPRPCTAYAISKMAQDSLAVMFGQMRRLDIVRTRIFNVLGPGQPEHLVPAAFIGQLRRRRHGEVLQVGNLSARRDFVDVRDVSLAFDRLLAKGQAGCAYNIASGASVAIGDLLEELLDISDMAGVTIKENAARMRPNDVLDVYADTTAIATDAQWSPRIPLRESLADMWYN